MKVAGLLLIVVGVVALAYQGFSYKEMHKDAQIGSLTIQHQETKSVWVPPVVGIVCIGAGIGMLAFSPRREA
jgi:multidrug transporter EmrE-like cation transporter